jgi:drug/metabolite transporter (DMT)-like permease
VFLTVLAAAALHAGWNALLKIRLDPFLAMVLINGAGGLIGLPALMITGLPNSESLPWLGASTLLHLGYYFALTSAYRRADMGQVYPIARGSAPLLTGLLSVMLLGEPLSPQGGMGIALLGFGIFVMSLKSAKDATHMDRRALLYAALTAVSICGYTLTDGAGARLSGNPHAYSAALFVTDGLCLTVIALLMRGTRGLRPILGFWGPGLAGGAMSCGAYGIAIWAMTVAPIPLVAAVRETSVLFGAAIAVIFLGEPLRANRVIAALLIVGGLAMIRLQ